MKVFQTSSLSLWKEAFIKDKVFPAQISILDRFGFFQKLKKKIDIISFPNFPYIVIFNIWVTVSVAIQLHNYKLSAN